jgi:DNA polymerase-3 subunit epsilon
VRDYLIFLDVETTGLPVQWNKPYDAVGNWPSAIQVAWIVYTRDGKEVKKQNHYVNDEHLEISNAAKKVHGITRRILEKNGVSRKKIFASLARDLERYRPLVVGHFIELDYHVLGADACRESVGHTLATFPAFCTMLATTHMVANPTKKYLKLRELYTLLFNMQMSSRHNALEDARATALCYFELLRREEINEVQITQQSKLIKEPAKEPVRKGCGLLVIAIVVLIIFSINFL